MNPLQTRGIPSWIAFPLLERCNLRCSMRHEWDDGGAYHGQETLAELALPLVLRTVRECLPARPCFEFFGGEPLLHAGIREVFALIRGAGCELACPTNGNLHEQSLTKIWQGEKASRVRAHLRPTLFPISTACCRYDAAAPSH
jgi:MoaA/NifB/PqqE/SkfB family radical SAM enzyme